jgi:hypothetical protein
MRNSLKKSDVLGIWSNKFYDPSDMEKQNESIGAFEWNGLRIKQFQKPE